MAGGAEPPVTPDFDDEAPLVGPLDGSLPKPDADRWLIIWRMSALLALVVLLVVVAVNLFPSPVRKPTVVLRPGPTATPAVPDGWARRGPSDASTVAFGQSPPLVGYACGPESDPVGSTPHTLNLYASADGGTTWRALSFQIAGLPGGGSVHGFFGMSCALSVDPTDSKDAALLVTYQACAQGPASALYRAGDGGATWQQRPLPTWDSSGELAQASDVVAWVGSTLYVRAVGPCGTGLNRVAVSTDDGAFRWVNDDALFAGSPSDATLGPLTPVAPYLYVRLDSRANCPPTCSLYKRTSDGGQTWTAFAATSQGQDLFLLDGIDAGGADSLFAQYYPAQQDPCSTTRDYFRSTDGGASWTPLPPLYEGLFIRQALATPDGTIYAVTASNCAVPSVLWGIYRHATGDGGWAQIASLPGGAPISLSWDQSGSPTGLWATPLSQAQERYLIYHTP